MDEKVFQDSRGEFRSFFGGGFECSTFRLRSGHRVDLVASTEHERLARLDYERMQDQGLLVAREGLRWHLVENLAGEHDFSSAEPIVHAARACGVQIIWDLCHFGWPVHLDIFEEQFATRFAAYAAAFARWLAEQTGSPGVFVPINEISFFSWAAAEEGSIFPFVTGRGFELKKQLVRCALRGMEAIRAVQPQARFMHVDPVIHVAPHPKHPEDAEAAEAYRRSQFQSWDMLAGRLCPELGGGPECLDLVGVNFYPHNEWLYDLKGSRRVRKFTPIRRKNPLYRPFRDILWEVHARYERPVYVAETGAENRARASWFRYVCEQVRAAIIEGIPVRGICLYPVLNHPGWVDERHCQNGLWDYAAADGTRALHAPLARELQRWRAVFEPGPLSALAGENNQVNRRTSERLDLCRIASSIHAPSTRGLTNNGASSRGSIG